MAILVLNPVDITQALSHVTSQQHTSHYSQLLPWSIYAFVLHCTHPSEISTPSPAHLPLPSQKLIQSSLLLSSKSTSCTHLWIQNFLTSPYTLVFFFQSSFPSQHKFNPKTELNPRLNLCLHTYPSPNLLYNSSGSHCYAPYQSSICTASLVLTLNPTNPVDYLFPSLATLSTSIILT